MHAHLGLLDGTYSKHSMNYGEKKKPTDVEII